MKIKNRKTYLICLAICIVTSLIIVLNLILGEFLPGFLIWLCCLSSMVLEVLCGGWKIAWGILKLSFKRYNPVLPFGILIAYWIVRFIIFLIVWSVVMYTFALVPCVWASVAFFKYGKELED